MKRWLSISAISFLIIITVAYGVCWKNINEETLQHTLRISLWDYDLTEYDRELVTKFEEQNPDIDIEVISYRSEVYPYYVRNLLDS